MAIETKALKKRNKIKLLSKVLAVVCLFTAVHFTAWANDNINPFKNDLKMDPAIKTQCMNLLRSPNRITSIGPRNTSINEIDFQHLRNKQKKSSAEANEFTFYNTAKDFTEQIGKKFAELVLSRVSSNGRTKIVIALGGAEHLGTLLELYILKNKLTANVEIVYVPLSNEIVQPWTAQETGSSAASKKMRSIGPIPMGWLQVKGSTSNPKAFQNFIQGYNLFSDKKILVVDTGFRGTTSEAINYISKQVGYVGSVEGVLLSHNPNTVNTIPIFSLNQTSGVDDALSTQWARVMDANDLDGSANASFQSAFQRSEALEVKNENGVLEVRRKPISQSSREMLFYRAVLAGIFDGI